MAWHGSIGIGDLLDLLVLGSACTPVQSTSLMCVLRKQSDKGSLKFQQVGSLTAEEAPH